MNKYILTLFVILFCHYSIVLCQTKTPYQKKQNQIMTEMCKAIGVNNSLIQMAINLNDWDIVKTSQDLAFKSRMMDKNELLIIIFATDKKLKDAEKLKNDIDFKRDAEKKAKEVNTKKIEEQKKQKQIQIIEDRKIEEEKNNLYEKSDYFQIINQIKTNFSKWLLKGEFEKSEEYNIRLENREIIFLDFCNEAVLKQIERKSEFQSEDDYYENKNNLENSFELFEYNADKEYFPFKWTYKNITFSDSIFVPLKDAPDFKKETNYKNIHLSNKRSDYCLIENYIYSRKILIDNLNDKNKIEISLDFNINPKRIEFNTNDIQLKNYVFETLKFDFEGYKSLKSEILIKNAEKIENTGNYQEALKLYVNILEFDKNSKLAKYKISQITESINEINRAEFINNAETLYNNGLLSQSREKYIEAIRIRSSEDINKIIFEIDKIITESDIKNNEILNAHNINSSNNEISVSSKIITDLVNIRKIYGIKYKSCIDAINLELNSKWLKLNDDYNLFIKNNNKEIWTIKNQELLEKLILFNQEYNKYKLFEDNIFKALRNEDKKYLKILKEDSEKIIIETVIKTY